ncbi:unnamed protein product, partial [Mesorhabditis spiculigera]
MYNIVVGKCCGDDAVSKKACPLAQQYMQNLLKLFTEDVGPMLQAVQWLITGKMLPQQVFTWEMKDDSMEYFLADMVLPVMFGQLVRRYTNPMRAELEAERDHLRHTLFKQLTSILLSGQNLTEAETDTSELHGVHEAVQRRREEDGWIEEEEADVEDEMEEEEDDDWQEPVKAKWREEPKAPLKLFYFCPADITLLLPLLSWIGAERGPRPAFPLGPWGLVVGPAWPLISALPVPRPLQKMVVAQLSLLALPMLLLVAQQASAGPVDEHGRIRKSPYVDFSSPDLVQPFIRFRRGAPEEDLQHFLRFRKSDPSSDPVHHFIRFRKSDDALQPFIRFRRAMDELHPFLRFRRSASEVLPEPAGLDAE